MDDKPDNFVVLITHTAEQSNQAGLGPEVIDFWLNLFDLMISK